MSSACLFNIQKFSLHDGPGIRTTVFFKGCPLRCMWCANPESLAGRVQVMWNRERCTECGACLSACPRGAVYPGQGVDQAHCPGCGICVGACKAGALTVSGREYGMDEVMRECLADRDFYEESGGGVTLSGGEVSAQAEFAVELLKRLRGVGIRTAVETNGFARPDVFAELVTATDLVLFDVKHYDDTKHKEGTGVGNVSILANLSAALRSGNEVRVRIPVIRGYSDGLEDARGFARLLVGMGVKRVELLPFHQFGQNKYAWLGMEYGLEGVGQLHKEDLAGYCALMLKEGMKEVLCN